MLLKESDGSCQQQQEHHWELSGAEAAVNIADFFICSLQMFYCAHAADNIRFTSLGKVNVSLTQL